MSLGTKPAIPLNGTPTSNGASTAIGQDPTKFPRPGSGQSGCPGPASLPAARALINYLLSAQQSARVAKTKVRQVEWLWVIETRPWKSKEGVRDDNDHPATCIS
jgi:hypothetical protein